MKMNTPNFKIRPFEPTDFDYTAIVKLFNQEWPNNPSTVEFWKQKDSKPNLKHLNRRYIGEIENENGKQIIAFGFIENLGSAKKPRKYYINFYIDKGFKAQGLGEPLYNQMVTELTDKNPVELTTQTQKDNASQIELLQQKGFQQNKKAKRYSELNVSNFEFNAFTGYTKKVAASGIEIVNLQELQMRDSNWMKKLYELQETVMRETLAPNEFQSIALDEYAKMFERIDFRADAHFVAIDGDNYVGLSSLWPDPINKNLLFVGTTSVLQAYRRRGIATALKIKTIALAQAYGASAIQTRNVVNSPMYALNMKLGFKPGLTLLFFEKVL